MPSPDPRIESLLVQAGFSDVAKLWEDKINDALVISFVDRWRVESHMIHLLIGEYTITLEDVVL